MRRGALFLTLLGAGPAPDMVRIPAGPFVMGAEDQADERPRRTVILSAFDLDRDEVTLADYTRCVTDAACAPRAGARPDDATSTIPVTGVRHGDAERFCRHAGKRLPTEAEWEKAARGAEGRVYPWGDAPECARANFGNYQGEGLCPENPGRPARVGSYPEGASPYGVNDLAGNVWEWVADRYDPGYYAHAPAHDPKGPTRGSKRVVRGGGCCSMFDVPRAANRLAFPPDYADVDLGFRCARSL